MHLSNYYAFLALDIARQRANEAREARLAALAKPGEQHAGAIRRSIARVALVVARLADAEATRSPLTTH
jgi:hypothetical protein